MHERALVGHTRIFNTLLVFSVLAAAIGCSGLDGAKPLPNLVPVSGTVDFWGDPLDHGTVYFIPMDPKTCQPASGIVKDGKFKMVTTVSAQGVMAGKYNVTIESIEPPEYNPRDVSPTGAPSSLIPTKYNSIETSGIPPVEVKSGMGPVNLELKK